MSIWASVDLEHKALGWSDEYDDDPEKLDMIVDVATTYLPTVRVSIFPKSEGESAEAYLSVASARLLVEKLNKAIRYAES